MSLRVLPPAIDTRSADALVKLLRGMAPHYTPEWAAKDDDDPGVALARGFAFLSEGVIDRLNRAPDRNFFAFLDMLGIRLLPATPARGPLRFLPANGLTGTVDVVAGTEASASAPSGPIPFETDEDLRVVAANLTALVAADPLTDNIYLPPPGFLALDAVAGELPPHTVQAFSEAGSSTFQLDFADQLKPGDILRVRQPVTRAGIAACADGSDDTTIVSDYLVVSDVKGSVVTLTDPLPRDYAEGTSVEKVTRFSLLEGKNVQEHVLYVAHSDYFSVKSEASFALRLTLAPGTAAGGSPMPVKWEYWGSIATAPSAPDGWQPFEVEADGSAGFTDTGTIQLLKPEGEIKQKPINRVNSRWIRARLDGPLPTMPPPAVPRVDSIQLRVSSTGSGIEPDQAFNNDTPLSLNQPYPPFGFEPRTFDRFYLASSEAFAKPRASVELDVTLDVSELLGAPSAVFSAGKVRVFAHGAGGVLDEFVIELAATGQAPPVIHPQPTGTRVTAGSIPAAVVDGAGGRVGVFVKADDGNVWQRWIPSGDPNLSQGSQWINLQGPSGSKLQFDPAAVFINGGWKVFVVMGGKVFSRSVAPADPGSAASWNALAPQSFAAASTPFASVAQDGTLRVVVFDVVPGNPDASGQTWSWDGQGWKNITPLGTGGSTPDGFLAAPGCRPWVQLYGTAPVSIRVFLLNKSSQLVVFDQTKSEIWGAPDAVKLLSSPVAFATNPENLSTVRVFVRGSGSMLCEAASNPGASPPSTWLTHNGPPGANLAGDPFLLSYSGSSTVVREFFSVFSGSDKNTMLEFRSAPGGMTTGALRAGPLELIPLESAIDASGGDMFVLLLDGPDQGAILQIVDGSTNTTFAKLDGQLSSPIAKDTDYQLFKKVESGTLQGAPADNKVTLKAGTAAATGQNEYVLVDGVNPQLREITGKSNDTVTVKDDFNPRPQAGDQYKLLKAQGASQKAQDLAAQTVLLASGASSSDDAYQGQYLQVTDAGGTSQPLKIMRYVGADRAAILASPAPGGTGYTIAAAPFPQAWFTYSDVDQSDLRPQLSWEYWNGRGWVNFPDLKDKTSNLLVSDKITFTLPEDVAQTEVAGQKNYWIRARIVGGDYGRESFTFNFDPTKPSTATVNKSSIRPPFIQSLTISYSMTQDQLPQACLTLNNLDWLDQTAANDVPGKFFQPFLPLPVAQQTLFVGFDQPFEGGPARLYFAARELAVDESNAPMLAWEYAAANDWKPVPSEDSTHAFTRPDRVTVSLPPDWQERTQFGRALSWIRARLASGAWNETPVFSGVFPNTCWAIQARTIQNEILGSGTDEPNATFHFSQVPVLPAEADQPGEAVRVREALTDDERAKLTASAGEDAVFVVLDNQGKPLETWVRWTEVLEFYDSQPGDRVYRLDRADGEIQFGDGVNGRVPPIGGDNIVAFSYRAGGGLQGNVAAKQIDTLVTAVAGIQSVSNPDGFGGGSEKATPQQMLVFGPAQISNRGRAVTPGDFETLAMEASRQVRKARCVPDRNSSGQSETGWVSVYIVPDSTDPQPAPTLELRRTVEGYLLDRVVVTVKDLDRIFVGPPDYVVVSVEATAFAKSLDKIGEAETAVRQKLAAFLHPLTGGPDGEGWDFGRELAASDLYAALEDINTVDHIGPITLSFGGQTSTDRVTVGPNQLLAGGEHTIRMDAGGRI